MGRAGGGGRVDGPAGMGFLVGKNELKIENWKLKIVNCRFNLQRGR